MPRNRTSLVEIMIPIIMLCLIAAFLYLIGYLFVYKFVYVGQIEPRVNRADYIIEAKALADLLPVGNPDGREGFQDQKWDDRHDNEALMIDMGMPKSTQLNEVSSRRLKAYVISKRPQE